MSDDITIYMQAYHYARAQGQTRSEAYDAANLFCRQAIGVGRTNQVLRTLPPGKAMMP